MRVTRAKQYRRHLRFFRIVYGISAPYKASFEREDLRFNPMMWHEFYEQSKVTKPAGTLGISMDLTVQSTV